MTAAPALRQEYGAITAAAAGLTEDDFELPTRCGGWNVGDLLYHLSRDARRACIALVSPVKGRPDVDAITYWQARPRTPGGRSPYATSAEVRAVWEALSEVAGLAAEAASPETLISRQGHVLTTPDFLATLVTEATIHGLDLAAALHRHPWAGEGAMAITRATLVGLLGGEPPPVLGWDDLTFVLKGTGRAPVTPEERSSLATRAGRLPLLA